MIVKKGNKYAVVSKSGEQMGEYDSKAEATKRLKQIEYFKMKAKKKMYKGGGKIDPTKKMKKADEAEIDRRYGSAVGTNPRTGKSNYPNSADMDKYPATAGSAGNPDKLRKAISDKYYAEKRKEMGIDKIKTYKKGGMLGKKC